MPKVYEHAESVEAIAKRLLPNYHPELATAEIQYVFVDKASMKSGRPVLGKVRKLSGAIEFLLDKHFLVEIPLDKWNDLTEEQRRALVDHLLERCTGEEDESSGEIKWKMREPDVQEFTSILKRHGAWHNDLVPFISVAHQIQVDERVQDVVDNETRAEVTTTQN